MEILIALLFIFSLIQHFPSQLISNAHFLIASLSLFQPSSVRIYVRMHRMSDLKRQTNDLHCMSISLSFSGLMISAWDCALQTSYGLLECSLLCSILSLPLISTLFRG